MSADPDNDASLVSAVRHGHRDAAEQLARRYLRAGREAAYAIVRDLDTAEDVCQDAFVYAIRRIDECRHPDRFGGWFLTIVRNRGRNHLRNLRRSKVIYGEVPNDASSAHAPEALAEQTELRERLLSALCMLPPLRVSVLLLHDLEGWTHAEIARNLAMPSGTVRSHLHFARKALRLLIGDRHGEGA